jgi:hypothetical protein
MKVRKKLAEWSKTEEGIKKYNEVAAEMRAAISEEENSDKK